MKISKKTIIFLFFIICIIPSFSQRKVSSKVESPIEELTEAPVKVDLNYSKDTLIIFYDTSSKMPKENLLKAIKNYNATIIYEYEAINGIAIYIPSDKKLEDAISYFEKTEGVLEVLKDFIMTIQ